MTQIVRGVYTITCTANGRRYVGSSADVHNRWAHHVAALNGGRHHIAALQADWDTHGREAFEFRTVAVIKDAETRLDMEQVLLDKVLAEGVAYNLTTSSRDCSGRQVSPEVRLVISEKVRGSKHSPEAIRKIGEASRAMWDERGPDDENRERMAAMGRARKGTRQSDEARARMRASQRARTDHKGSDNQNAKLTPEQVTEIRQRYAAGGVSQAALAREYGISQGGISKIILGKSYTTGS